MDKHDLHTTSRHLGFLIDCLQGEIDACFGEGEVYADRQGRVIVKVHDVEFTLNETGHSFKIISYNKLPKIPLRVIRDALLRLNSIVLK